MITYRKTSHLRVRHTALPQPPWWCATSIAPYAAKRAAPVAIDYVDLRASWSERLEVGVCEDVRDELERTFLRQRLQPPALVDAAEFAENIFRRGEAALTWLEEQNVGAVILVSAHGALPEEPHPDATIAIAAWPLDFIRLDEILTEAAKRQGRWGVAVPVLFPVTTNLTALDEIAALAQRYGASFLAPFSIEADATAKQAIARSLTLDDDGETYAMLFHADLDPIHVATERHIAALAEELGIDDFVAPPGWPAPSNWNAASALMLTATRMLAMEYETELAGSLARSARVVAELDKPLSRIAAAAPLSIVESLDEASVDILADWLVSGRSPFIEKVNERWRLRRDAGV